MPQFDRECWEMNNLRTIRRSMWNHISRTDSRWKTGLSLTYPYEWSLYKINEINRVLDADNWVSGVVVARASLCSGVHNVSSSVAVPSALGRRPRRGSRWIRHQKIFLWFPLLPDLASFKRIEIFHQYFFCIIMI